MRHHQNPPHRTRPRRLRWIAAAAITAAAAVASSTAAADARTDTPAPVDVAVASYAADYGVSHAEAQRRLDRIPSLQEILALIREAEGARHAGWGIDHQGTFTGWVWLTGQQPPSGSAAHIADAHPDVEIRAGAGHTLDELLAAQTGLFQDIGPVGQAIENPGTTARIRPIVVYTDIDMAANRVVIGIDPALADPGPLGATDETLQTKITETTQLLQHDLAVPYIVEDGRGMSVNADFKGGEGMHLCTSGFAAQQRRTGVYGLITAGHCFRSNDDPITMHNTSLPLIVRVWGPNVDAQFRGIPTGASHRIFDDHICGPGSPCDVRGDISRSQMANNYLCHHGKNTGASCGTVISINHRPTSSQACSSSCSNTFVRVYGDGLKGCRGDSGGPWYDRGYAFGIQGGGTDPKNCASSGKTLYFSAIRDVENALGVDILTTGPFTIS